MDEGLPVLSVADGVVSSTISPPCPTENRYGCYIDIDHSSYFQTRYVHLEEVNVTLGQSVTKGDFIGAVGQSGTNNPHLHLSFWHREYLDGIFQYLSYCYNNGQTCPNNELPFWPQGYKPSCMETSLGCTFLIDGGQFTSVNGQLIFLPNILK
jgi:murein DD-endopeptidase MepM/ murein hydrolase activator NlpD